MRSVELEPEDVLALERPSSAFLSAANEAIDATKPRLERDSLGRFGRDLAAFALRLHERLLGLYGAATLLVLWELLPRLHWIESQFFPPLSRVLLEGWRLAATGALFEHIAVSLGRTLLGFGGALAIGVPLGFLLGGRFPRLARFLLPLFMLLGQVNAFSLFPIFVLFFGIGEVAKFAIIAWACLWPLLLGTLRGVAAVDPLLVKTARSMGCDGITLLRDVLFPAALPIILGGARVGLLVAFIMLVGAEMVGASTGLGWLVHNASMNYVIPRLFLAALIIAVLGALAQRGLLRLERHLVFWRQEEGARS